MLGMSARAGQPVFHGTGSGTKEGRSWKQCGGQNRSLILLFASETYICCHQVNLDSSF